MPTRSRLPSEPVDLPSAKANRTDELRTFGRRRGRKASPHQRRLLDTTLPLVAVHLEHPAAEQIVAAQPLWIEIGFGGAEHLLWQARANPNVAFIGCEPFEDGVVKALAGIEASGLTNVKIHADDARAVLRWLPPGAVDRAFVLFPDPWPKKKHVKRRLVCTPTLDLLARIMKPGAELRIATDIGDYARTILLAVTNHPSFEWPARGPRDWRERPSDWPPTRYEEKAVRDGRRCAYFTFRRKDRARSERDQEHLQPAN